jgi:hypothetical protein
VTQLQAIRLIASECSGAVVGLIVRRCRRRAAVGLVGSSLECTPRLFSFDFGALRFSGKLLTRRGRAFASSC